MKTPKKTKQKDARTKIAGYPAKPIYRKGETDKVKRISTPEKEPIMIKPIYQRISTPDEDLTMNQQKKDMVRTTVTIPGELWESAKIRAVEERTDLSSLINKALEAYLKKGGSR